MKHAELTDRIIRCFYTVYSRLGYGFLEKVYEKALQIELRNDGLCVQSQAPIKVHYVGEVVGEYFADLLINEKVIVEIKASQKLSAGHEAQLINYLKATDAEVGLLLNFGPKAEVLRKVFDNDKK
jgi:GxxExxY protein